MENLMIGVGFVAITLSWIYNSLISKKNEVDNVFAGLDAVLKKRYDLIPNLVASVKEYMTHEKSTLEKIAELRSQAMSPNLSSNQKMALEKEFSSALGNILVAVENYPNLKANENFAHLQATLNEIEEQISAARRAYNQSITDYNNAIEMFPTSLMARFMKLERKAVFQISETERQNVSVKNLFQ